MPIKKTFSTLTVAAALIFSLFSCKAINTQQKIYPIIDTSTVVKKDTLIMHTQATITGRVTAKDQPLAGAELFLDGELVGQTKQDGSFSFERKFDGYPKPYLLTVKSSDYSDVSRTYHPVMMSTSYDIAMKESCCSYGGSKSLCSSIDLFFSKKNMTLTEEAKTELEKMAATLRNDPAVKMELVAIANSGVEKALAKYRQELIVTYLVNEEGISEERIQLKIEQEKKSTIRVGIAK